MWPVATVSDSADYRIPPCRIFYWTVLLETVQKQSETTEWQRVIQNNLWRGKLPGAM